MSALTYEAAKKQVIAAAVPVRSAYRGRRIAVTTNATGMSGARIPYCDTVRVDELAELARQLAERVGQAALELLGEDDVAEAVPGVRRAVHEVRPERPGAQGQLEVDEDDGRHEQADAGQDEPAAPPDPGSTARTYSPTGIASSRVSEWLPTASPKTTVAASR